MNGASGYMYQSNRKKTPGNLETTAANHKPEVR